MDVFGIFFCKASAQGFCLVSSRFWGFLFCVLVYMFWIHVPCETCSLWIFPSLTCLPISLAMSFKEAQLSIVIKCNWSLFKKWFMLFCVLRKLCLPQGCKDFLLFPSRSFIIFYGSVHGPFWINFCVCHEVRVVFHFFPTWISSFYGTTYYKDHLSALNYFGAFCISGLCSVPWICMAVLMPTLCCLDYCIVNIAIVLTKYQAWFQMLYRQ